MMSDLPSSESEHVVEAMECLCDHLLQLRQVFSQRCVYLTHLQTVLLAPFATLCQQHKDRLQAQLDKRKATLVEVKQGLSQLCQEVEGLKTSIAKAMDLGMSGKQIDKLIASLGDTRERRNHMATLMERAGTAKSIAQVQVRFIIYDLWLCLLSLCHI
jgi:flagellar biosynthesis chaperone FliJ